jgi:hypothetical protein
VPLTKHILAARVLRNKYETNRLLALYDTYLLLKHFAGQPGIIKPSNINELSVFCKVSKKTFLKRIDYLSILGWVHYKHPKFAAYGGVSIASWKHICQQQEIKYTNEFTTTEYCTTDAARMQDLAFAVEIADNKVCQATGWKRKLDSNHEHLSLLKSVLVQQGACYEKLQNFLYFTKRMRLLYIQDFKFGSSAHNVIQLYRPFFERGVFAMHKAYNMKTKQSASYCKKILTLRKVIKVQKHQILSETRGRGKGLNVLWIESLQQTVLKQADEIIILKKTTSHNTSKVVGGTAMKREVTYA